MSSVQAVIAALNQQNTQNDKRQQQQPVNRQSIKDRFGITPNAIVDLKTHRSSHTTTTTSTDSMNRSSSSLVPLRHDSLRDPAIRAKMNHQETTKQQLIEEMNKMNAEINQLKQQLHGKTIDTPMSRACELPETEMTTLPPACFIWFDVDGDTMNYNNTKNNHISSSSPEIDYDDIISDYNRHIFNKGQQQQHINTLQSQLTACEIGTQWMMSKYLGELELERLHARSLDTIVQNQENLIDIMESKSIESVEQSHQKQHTFLLHSQLELQRMELDDKQEMMTLMADERDILVKKIKRLTQQLHQQQHYTNKQQYVMETTERRSKNHPRTVSSSSTCSTSSYNTTVSSTSISCSDWANINSIHQHNQSTYLLSSMSKPPPIAASAAAANLYSPPQTPPPREKLPPLPTSSSSSSVITTPNLSPRSTVLSATPSLSSSLATLDSSILSLDYQRSLPHQNSMPDIRSHQDYHHQQYHRRATHHYRRDSGDPNLTSFTGGLEKGTMRQKSFWKGWRQRLSS